MLKKNHDQSRLTKVLIATPLGQGGMGGIDRMMDLVRERLKTSPIQGIEVGFGVTRGQGHILLSAYYLMLVIFCLIRRRICGQIDVFHINLSSHGSTRRKIIMAWCARELGIPYIIHLHSSRYESFLEEASPKLRNRITNMFRHAARVIVLGNAWKTFVKEKFTLADDKITIVPNATPIPVLRHVTAANGVVRILFLGRVGPRKGVPQLIKALAELNNLPCWKAVIAGDGEVEKAAAEISSLGLGDRIVLTGWVGPAEVAKLLSASDILVLPSFNENLPMSVIEGMAAGLAIVTTPVGAVEDIIIPGKTGMLVPVGEVGSLSAALKMLIEDSELRRQLGENAEAFHRLHLDMGPYLDKLGTLWTQVAGERLMRMQDHLK